MAVEFKHGDYIKGGWALVKANLVPCIVALVIAIVLECTIIGILVLPQMFVNLYKGLKENKQSGKPIEIGSLFAFDNFVNNLLVAIIEMVVNMVASFIPFGGLLAQPLFIFTFAILADKPGIGFMDALKGSVAFAKGNYVPCLIFNLLCFVLIIIGAIPCGLGLLVVIPTIMAAKWIAYEEHKAAVAAAAAEMGVTLA